MMFVDIPGALEFDCPMFEHLRNPPVRQQDQSSTYLVAFLVLALLLVCVGCHSHRISPISRAELVRLVDALGSQDISQSEAAQKAIRQHGTRCVPLLLQLLREDENGMGEYAAHAFVVLGKAAEPAVANLDEMLRSNKGTALTAVSLAGIGPAGTESLLKHLKDENPRVRALAAIGLGGVQSGDTEVPLALTGALKDTAPTVRTAAASSLGHLLLLPERVVPALVVTAVSDTNHNTRFSALRAIGAFGNRSIPFVSPITALTNDPDPIIREAARTAMSRVNLER